MTTNEDGTEVAEDDVVVGGPAAGSWPSDGSAPRTSGPSVSAPHRSCACWRKRPGRRSGARGFHRCPFCVDAGFRPTRYRAADGAELHLGSAAIEVCDASGRTWQAPNLVLHYVTAHGYQPPAPLVETHGTAR